MRSEPPEGSAAFSEKLAFQERSSVAHGSASPTKQGPTTASRISLWSLFRLRYLCSCLRSSLRRLMTHCSNWPSTSRSWGRLSTDQWSEFRSSGIYGGANRPPRNSWLDLCSHLRELDSDHLSGTGQISPKKDP